jgi:hypothetical protein
MGIWKSPAFLITAIVLFIAAVGLNGATSYLQLHFRKLPVALQKPLKQLPKDLGPWVQVSIDMPLSHDIQEVLGTAEYIFRDYVDTRLVPASRMAEFEGKDADERRALVYGRGEKLDADGKVVQKAIRGIMTDYPTAVMSLSVTYYTGMVDTVAHIPDRCFIADGFRPTDYDTISWPLKGFPVDSEGYRLDEAGRRKAFPAEAKSYQDNGVPVRFINFEDQDNRTRTRNRNVTYFFQVNGKYDSNPLGVRKTLQDLFQKNGYYTKVELMTMLSDRAETARVQQDFLTFALPELERCFPDWAAVLSGKAAAGVQSSGAATRPAGEAKPADEAKAASEAKTVNETKTGGDAGTQTKPAATPQ